MKLNYVWLALAALFVAMSSGCSYLTPPTVAASGPKIEIEKPATTDTSTRTRTKHWRIIIKRPGKTPFVVRHEGGTP